MTTMIERRSLAIDELESSVPLLAVERRCEDGGTNEREWIVGYAAKFNTNSLEIEGRFIERLLPTAFNVVQERRGRKKPLETRALWNHDPSYPLARYPGTLKLSVDDVGLRYEFPVPDTTYGRDLASNIKAGIVRGSSFSFSVAKGGESWTTEDGRSVRTISAVDSLVDVGPVTFPAYPDADVTVAQRSYDAWKSRQQSVTEARRSANAEIREKVRELREWMESRAFCSTGAGNGIDNSCSSKGGGGGGGGSGGGGGKSTSPGALDSAYSKMQKGMAGNVLITDLKKHFPDASHEQFSKMLRQGVDDGKYSMTSVDNKSAYTKEQLDSGIVQKGFNHGSIRFPDETMHMVLARPEKKQEIQASAAKHDAEQSKASNSTKSQSVPSPSSKADKSVVDGFLNSKKPDTSVENMIRLTKIQAKMRESGDEKGAMALQAAVQEKLKAHPPPGYGKKAADKPGKKS